MARKQIKVDQKVTPAPGWRRQYVGAPGKKQVVVYVRERMQVRTPRDTWRIHNKERGVAPEPIRRQVVSDGDIIDVVIREMILGERQKRRETIEADVDAADAQFKGALQAAMKTTARGRLVLKLDPTVEASSLSHWEGVYKLSFRTPYRDGRERREDVNGDMVISAAIGKKLRELEKAKRVLDDEQRMLRDDQLLQRRRQKMHELIKEDEDTLKELRAIVERALVKQGETRRAKVKAA